jgi:general secretion pathway protein D
MKKLIACLALFPLAALGKPVSFHFDAVSLMSFSQATFKGIMGRDFVIAPDVLAADRRITISVKNIEQSDVPLFVEGLLAREGIQATLRGGIYYLTVRQRTLEVADLQRETGSSEGAGYKRLGQVEGLNAAQGDSDGGQLLQEPLQRVRNEDDETELCQPQQRTAEFVASVIAAGYGSKAATVAGEFVVLSGSKNAVAKMTSLCKSLDTHAKMVDVSASWIEVTSNDGQGRGISLAASFLGARLGASLGLVNSGSAISLRNTKFELVIDALNSDARFKQVTNSRLVGYDRTKLKLTVGDKTATVSSTGNDNAGNRVQNVVYTPSGVIIDAFPRVLGNGGISLDVDAQISSFKANTSGLVGAPTLILRQLVTTVGLRDGDVMLLGGLQESQSSDTKSRLAFLPESWSVSSANKQQTDLVLVVSAKVISD